MRAVSIVVAIAMAILAALAADKFLGGNDELVNQPAVVQQEVATIDIIVAKQTIPVGTAIKPEMLLRQPWPSKLKLEGFIANEQSKDIIGFVTRAPFQAGEPILRTKLANKNDPNFLASALPEGMRAITVKVDEVSSVGGFVFPGDRVDVLIRHGVNMKINDSNLRSENVRTVPREVSELLVEDAKVLAVGQNSDYSTSEGVKIPRSVTLEVSRKSAQKLLWGQKSGGKISLALRPLNEDEEDRKIVEKTPNATTLETVTRVSLDEIGEGVKVIRGTRVGDSKRKN